MHVFLLIISVKLFSSFGEVFFDLLLHLFVNVDLFLGLGLTFSRGLSSSQNGDALVTISSQVVALFLVPDVAELFNSVKDETAVIVAEFTVLTEGVKADNELLFADLEFLELNLRPGSLFLLPRLSSSELRFLSSSDLFIIDSLLLGDFISTSGDIVVVIDGGVKGLVG